MNLYFFAIHVTSLVYGAKEFLIKSSFFENEFLEKAVLTYFKNINCITEIHVNTGNKDIIHEVYLSVPMYRKRIMLGGMQVNWNMEWRPRRDIVDPMGTLTSYCPESSQGFLVNVPSLLDLHNYVLTEVAVALWSPQARIFVFVRERLLAAHLEDIMRTIWRIYKTPHVVVADLAARLIYKYNPFIPVFPDTWGMLLCFSFIELFANPDLINTSLMDLNGYPLQVVLFRSVSSRYRNGSENDDKVEREDLNSWEGLEADALRLLAKRVNFTCRISSPADSGQYGYRMTDSYQFTGGLGELTAGRADLVAVNYFVTWYESRDVELLATTQTDRLCLVTRKADRVPDWQLLWHCLAPGTWFVLAVACFAITMQGLLLGRVPHPCLNIVRLVTCAGLPYTFNRLSERVCFACYLLAFVTIGGAFQGSLVSVFSAQVTYPQLETLEQVSHTSMDIITTYEFIMREVWPPADATTSQSSGDSLSTRLRAMMHMYSGGDITNAVVEGHRYLTLIRQSEFDLNRKTTSRTDDRGEELVHLVPECPRSYSLAMLVPVNHYLAPRLNQVLLDAAQAGLYVHWYKQETFTVFRQRTLSPRPDSRDGFKVFSVKDLQIAFCILLIGYFFSCGTFLYEIKLQPIILRIIFFIKVKINILTLYITE